MADLALEDITIGLQENTQLVDLVSPAAVLCLNLRGLGDVTSTEGAECADDHHTVRISEYFVGPRNTKASSCRLQYNPTPESLLACDLVNIEEGYMNSWEAVLQRVKVEYLGLNPNIQGPEIYSLRS